MRFLALILLLLTSGCMIPRMTPALRETFPKMVKEHNDTVCLDEEYDWIKSDSAIHINCRHDAVNKITNHRKY